jgi:hypothetical protein
MLDSRTREPHMHFIIEVYAKFNLRISLIDAGAKIHVAKRFIDLTTSGCGDGLMVAVHNPCGGNSSGSAGTTP